LQSGRVEQLARPSDVLGLGAVSEHRHGVQAAHKLADSRKSYKTVEESDRWVRPISRRNLCASPW
jgi:hypothetical protein